MRPAYPYHLADGRLGNIVDKRWRQPLCRPAPESRPAHRRKKSVRLECSEVVVLTFGYLALAFGADLSIAYQALTSPQNDNRFGTFSEPQRLTSGYLSKRVFAPARATSLGVVERRHKRGLGLNYDPSAVTPTCRSRMSYPEPSGSLRAESKPGRISALTHRYTGSLAWPAPPHI